MKNLTQRSRGAEGNDQMMNVLHVPSVPDVPSVDDEARPSTASHEPWPRVKLGDVCEICPGTRVRRKDSQGGRYPVYGGGGATFNWPEYNREDQLIVSRFAMSEECVRFVNGRFFLNDSGLSVSSADERLSQTFLDWCLLGRQQEIYSLGRGAAQKNLDMDQFPQVEIPLPALPVQRSIVARLERELGAVEKVAKAFDELERSAEGEFKAELKETFEEISRGGAETRRLGDVCESISSRGHQIKQSEIAEVGRFPVVSQSENEIEGYTDRDIAISETPLVLFGDHTCVVKLIDKPFVVGADGVKLLRIADCLPRYLYSWLQQAAANLLDGEYRRHFTDLCELIIPLPPLPVQREIVARLDAARERKERLVSSAKRGREAAALWRKAILKEAFE